MLQPREVPCKRWFHSRLSDPDETERELTVLHAFGEVLPMPTENAQNLSAVRAQDWIITPEIPEERRRRLIDVPPSADLIKRIAEEAMGAAKSSRIPNPTHIQADEQPGYYRAQARIPVTDEAFDQLFNGRSGYRANYYLSPEQGATFNRALVDCLIPAILHACSRDQELIDRSLRGRYSKIWVAGDGKSFWDCPPALVPERWVTYWRRKSSDTCLRMPLPRPPQIDVKGTFINPTTGQEWLPKIKEDRDKDIHLKGLA